MNTFFNFEIKNWLRAPMPWIFLFLFALLVFGATVSDNLTIGGSFGNVPKNAPFVSQNLYAIFSLLCILLVAAFVNSAAIRDFEQNVHQLIFSKPIKKRDYYFGHFFGAFLIALIPFLGVAIGVTLGTVLNGIFEFMEPERFGPLDFSGHIWGYLVFVIPNTFFTACVLYAVATKTKSNIYPFVAGILLLVGYVVARNLMSDMENETLSGMLDPFGMAAYAIQTKYWTVDQKTTQVLGLSGMVLWNRLLWTAVGAFILMLGYWVFDFSEKKSKKGKKSAENKAEAAHSSVFRTLEALPKVTPSRGFRMELIQLWSQYKTEIKGIVKSVPFLLLALLGLLNCVPNLFRANQAYGIHELPVTYSIIEIIRGTFYLFGLIIMVFYSGQLIWKERTAKMDGIHDAFPVKNWVLYMGKFLSVISVMFILQVLLIITSVFIQKSMDFTDHNIGMLVKELLILDMFFFILFTAFSMFIHSLSKNMYLGFGLVIGLFFAMDTAFPAMNISSNMVLFGGSPSYTLSDFYGYAPFLKGLTWFSVYWLLFSAVLAFFTFLFWQRGSESGWRGKVRLAKQELGTYKLYGMATGLLFLSVAGFTYYNTFVVNEFTDKKEGEILLVEYEQLYKQYENRAQPRIFDVKYDIDLHPEVRSMTLQGAYKIRNPHNTAIDTLFVTIPSHESKMELQSDRLKLLSDDVKHQFRMYTITPALVAGDTMDLTWTTSYAEKGFENELSFSRFVQNGTFFSNSDVSPVLGYTESGELSGKNERKEYDLPEKSRMPKLNRADTAALMHSYISSDAHWVTVETTIRTAPEQIAIAPGSLLKEWEEDGRRCFTYKLDHKAWNFYSFLSADYQVKRRTWKGIDLEVYYIEGHDYNVERMLDAMQKSLDYYTTNFGPYFHKQCRIIEFPRFASFAQAFPGTMPYSEAIGFIQDFKPEEGDNDMVFYVAAHEIGHQYWAHQECGGKMQGAEMTTETFAQYSALMVMEKEYGRDQMRKFLKYEMDKYLRGRGRETEQEMPIARCEGQGYTHYNKGSVAMYYLKEMIGEEQVNASLRAFLEEFRYKEAPFPTSMDAIDQFYAHTPDSLDYIVKDLFEDITLFENQCVEATAKALDGGKYEVTLKVKTQKFKSDELGKESEVPVADYVDIGAFAKATMDNDKLGKTLYRQRVHLTQPEATYTFIVDEKPDKAGIDPFVLLIDRDPVNNVKKVGLD